MEKWEDLRSRLAKSKFRSSFHLKDEDREYFYLKGEVEVRRHALEFLLGRLAPAKLEKDGKQTPFHGHPVFVAQHATGSCCRSCLWKWHKIPMNKELSNDEIGYIIEMIMNWIREDIKSSKYDRFQ